MVLFQKLNMIKSKSKKKVPKNSELVKNTNYNAKTSNIESKTPSISGLATTSELTAVENKIPNISSLVKRKPGYNTKNSEIAKRLTNILQLQSLISSQQISTNKFSNKDRF